MWSFTRCRGIDVDKPEAVGMDVNRWKLNKKTINNLRYKQQQTFVNSPLTGKYFKGKSAFDNGFTP